MHVESLSSPEFYHGKKHVLPTLFFCWICITLFLPGMRQIYVILSCTGVKVAFSPPPHTHIPLTPSKGSLKVLDLIIHCLGEKSGDYMTGNCNRTEMGVGGRSYSFLPA